MGWNLCYWESCGTENWLLCLNVLTPKLVLWCLYYLIMSVNVITVVIGATTVKYSPKSREGSFLVRGINWWFQNTVDKCWSESPLVVPQGSLWTVKGDWGSRVSGNKTGVGAWRISGGSLGRQWNEGGLRNDGIFSEVQ